MDGMRAILAALYCMMLVCVPAMAATSNLDILPAVQNVSVSVPPTALGSAGTRQSMTGYSGWLDNCANAAMSLVNQVMKAFGQKPLNWSKSSVKINGAGSTVDAYGSDASLTTIATITGSEDRLDTVMIPSGEYWELRYTAEPLVTREPVTASASPSLSIWIYDGLTGRDIARVEPPGGLDTATWARDGDPRPWTKQFTYGNGRGLYFDVTATSLKSYTIEVRTKQSR